MTAHLIDRYAETLITIPGAGHWPHHDQPALVTSTIIDWLDTTDLSAPGTRTNADTAGCCAP